jgi:hypothetical protein
VQQAVGGKRLQILSIHFCRPAKGPRPKFYIPHGKCDSLRLNYVTNHRLPRILGGWGWILKRESRPAKDRTCADSSGGGYKLTTADCSHQRLFSQFKYFYCTINE